MRVRKGFARKRMVKRRLQRAKGYRGAGSKLRTKATLTWTKAQQYAYRDRRNRKRDFRQLWVTRIRAAAVQHGMRYSQFMAGVSKAGVALNRKMLAELAAREPASFTKIAELVKQSC